MNRFLLFISFLFCFVFSSFAQEDEAAIRAVLQNFIDGTEYNYPEKILEAFRPETPMYLYDGTDTARVVSVETYANYYDNGRRGQRNKRYSTVLALDIQLDVAYAKLQVDIPYWGNRYYDMLLLKKIKGKWQILAKATSAEPLPKAPMEQIAKPTKDTVLSALNHPWSMAFLSENEAVVVERDGGLVLVDLKEKTKQNIQGLPTDVARKILIDTSKHVSGVFPSRAYGTMQNYNAGYFEVLLDPNFKENQYLYLSYAAENKKKESGVKVIRCKLIENQLTDIKTIFETKYSHGLFHYGGGMVFGKDGKLYIALGERNFFEHLNPVPPLSQDIHDKRGKIHRINSDGSIPADNPKFEIGTVPSLFALGIRATQGMTIHPETGEIWFTDHGTIQGDELNRLQAGANYGWPHKTSGRYRSKNYNPPIIEGTEFTDPVYFWEQTIAPTGLTFYKGREFPQWNGNVIVPGLSRGNLWRLVLENDKVISTEKLFVNEPVRLRKAVLSPRGKLYLLTDEDDGKVLLITNGNK